MISIKYKNAYGEISMGGARHPTHRVLTITGVGIPDATRNTVQYYGEPGQECIHEQINFRTISLSVEVDNRGGRGKIELERMAKILSHPGTLTIKTMRRTRCIYCNRCTSFSDSDRTELYRKTVLQFVCDNPYFEDTENTVHDIYIQNKLLTSPFTLPAVFSERIQKTTITNHGDTETEPVIHIYGAENNANTAAENIITIFNATTAQSITVVYELAEGETLTVDIPERKIYSSLDPDTQLFCISDDTFLSDFVLTEGDNLIEVMADCTRKTSVTIEYNNRYLEAIV